MSERPRFVVRTKRSDRKNWCTSKRTFQSCDRAIGYAEAMMDEQYFDHVKVCLPSGIGWIDYWKDGVEYRDAHIMAAGSRILWEGDDEL